MEQITSRKNAYVRHVRCLAADGDYRREQGEYLCDGVKTLKEALSFGARISSVLWKGSAQTVEGLGCDRQFVAPAELFDYASPMTNSPGPLFTVAMRGCGKLGALSGAIVLEGVQDPGNVGTVIRTANAFGVGAVVLTGACADPYHPKTVRATMGAIFRQNVLQIPLEYLGGWLEDMGLHLYGAALSPEAEDLRKVPLDHAAIAVGSEGSGLSAELLKLCEKKIIIPMAPDSESLNAAVAASILSWELVRGTIQ